jgi:hypothetical protein
MRPDLRRGLFYAAGGALANICVLLLLNSLFRGNRAALGSIPFPFSLLIGVGIGIACWAGVELGHAQWQRAESRRVGAGRPAARWALLAIGMSLALGVLAMLPKSSEVALITTIILSEAAVVALFHGYFTGAREEPGVAVGTLMALVFGILGGALFGLSAGIIYAVTYQPPACPQGCTITIGPVFGAIFLVVLAGVYGLVVGFGLSIASAFALLARPFTRHAPTGQT